MNKNNSVVLTVENNIIYTVYNNKDYNEEFAVIGYDEENEKFILKSPLNEIEIVSVKEIIKKYKEFNFYIDPYFGNKLEVIFFVPKKILFNDTVYTIKDESESYYEVEENSILILKKYCIPYEM